MSAPLHKAIASPKAFSKAVSAYVAACLVKDSAGKDSDIISIAGLCVSLGCHRDMLARWKDKYEAVTDHDPSCLISSAVKGLEESGELQLQRLAVLGRNSMSLALGNCKHVSIEQQHIKVDAKVSGSISVATGVPLAGDA